VIWIPASSSSACSEGATERLHVITAPSKVFVLRPCVIATWIWHKDSLSEIVPEPVAV